MKNYQKKAKKSIDFSVWFVYNKPILMKDSQKPEWLVSAEGGGREDKYV